MKNQRPNVKNFLRWWITAWTMFMSLAILSAMGMVNWLIDHDCTGISVGILLVFVTASVQFGYNIYKEKHHEVYEVPLKYFMGLCVSLGLLGTIAGMIITMSGTFQAIDPNNLSTIKPALVSISSGVGAALVTTLVGLVAYLLLELQLIIAVGRN